MLIEGSYRASICELEDNDGVLKAKVKKLPLYSRAKYDEVEAEALVRSVKDVFERYSEFFPKMPKEITLPFFDTLLESLVSISQFLLQNEKPHTIIKYNKQTGDFERIKINDYDELMNIAYRYIIDYDEGNSESSSLENFLKTNDISDCSSFTYITSELSSENEILPVHLHHVR